MPTPDAQPLWQIAECLLPGITVTDAQDLTEQVRGELAAGPWPRVAFLGALLIAEDEVLLCLFSGPQAEVRAVSERAGLPFERIVACVGLTASRAGTRQNAPGGP